MISEYMATHRKKSTVHRLGKKIGLQFLELRFRSEQCSNLFLIKVKEFMTNLVLFIGLPTSRGSVQNDVNSLN